MAEDRHEHHERLLLEARDEAQEALNRIEEEEAEPQTVSGGNVTRVTTGAEAASDVQEAEADFSQAARLSERLALIDTALRVLRSDPAAFDRCDNCGRPIEEERRAMIPWTRHCADCAKKLEAETATFPGGRG